MSEEAGQRPRTLTKTYHIIFDAIGVDQSLLQSEEFIFSLLLEIPKKIDMKILSGPHLVRDYDTGHEGLSGFAIIDFSHVSIHTFADSQEAYIDIFSCRPFDEKAIRNYLFEKLGVAPEQVQTHEVNYRWG
ncbi:MAG: S-adenosylmethionine decarboxylase [Candidatus Wildermuthbacteria bacterium]|nr:S-adenosylmethionine decarboxylase [Candidatus Wildermuthbacteria bacterium]